MDFYLQKLHDEIVAATRGLDNEALSRRPEGKWCAAEVLEHLYLSYRGTVKGLERCLREGKPLGRRPAMRDRLATAVVVGIGYMPSGRKSPEVAVPRGMPAEEVLRGILPQIAVMDETIGRCESRFGRQARLLDHPILGPLTAKQWRKLHWVHGKHHVKQIWKLRSRG